MKKVLISGALFGLLGLGCGDETILGYQCPSGEKQQQIRYRTNSVTTNQECESEVQVRFCLDGSWERWSGTFQFDSCSRTTKRSCSHPQAHHGQAEQQERFLSEKSAPGEPCISEKQFRRCLDGEWTQWSGSFQFDSCLTTCLFKDSALEAVIRETIGIPRGEIYAEDLVTTTRLSAPNRGIQDLAGLECWTSLEALDLSNRLDDEESPINQIVDIRPLENHVKLEYLDLRHNQIDDIRSLVDNTGIGEGDEIRLTGNPIDCEENEQYLLISKLMQSGVMLTSDCQ